MVGRSLFVCAKVLGVHRRNTFRNYRLPKPQDLRL
jgi:hypothetical protein